VPFLIDTDWVIDYLAGVQAAVALLDSHAADGISISVITYMEVYQGIEHSPSQKQIEDQFTRFLEAVPILSFSLPVARRCAAIRNTLRQQGRRVSSRALDLIIAATALEAGLTLVTRNVDDYKDISGLQIAPLLRN
jgi:predicted nucleic acid-binding protein